MGSPQVELERLEHAFMAALQRRDRGFLEWHLATEFTLTTGRPDVEVHDRAGWLEVAETEYVGESFGFDELLVYEYGRICVVRCRYRQTGQMGDADRTGAFRMTDVWDHRDGRWQLVARHSTAMLESSPPEGDRSIPASGDSG